MNLISRSPVAQWALCGLVAVLSSTVHNATTYAQSRADIIWCNVWYGPNVTGVGLAGRSGAFGIGATMFSFVGDTTRGFPIRPGGIGINVEGYLTAQLNERLAMYGSIGVSARLATHRDTPNEIQQAYYDDALMSLGSGFQVSATSHLMFGLGYNAMIDPSRLDGDPGFRAIHSVVAQLGYQL